MTTQLEKIELYLDEIKKAHEVDSDILESEVHDFTTALVLKREVCKAIYKWVEPMYDGLIINPKRKNSLHITLEYLIERLSRCQKYINVDTHINNLNNYLTDPLLNQKKIKGFGKQ
jgi:hypothetical protein